MQQTEGVDLTVMTLDPADYGAGAVDRVVFHDCKYRVEDGHLNVFPADGGHLGNVATFAPGQWVSVIRGRIVQLAGANIGQHTLQAVSS